jgi:hypothetical protein
MLCKHRKTYLLPHASATQHVTAENTALFPSFYGNNITFPGFHESPNDRLVFPRHIAKYT